MEDLITLLIEPLVSDINKVRIEKQENGQNVTFNVFVPREEIAKVIGKEGKMVKSIKNLVKIRAIKQNIFAHVEVQEA